MEEKMDHFQIEPQNQGHRDSFGPPAQLYLPPKDNKKRTLIIVLCVCAAALALILGGWYRHVHSPAYKVQKGLLGLAREMGERKNPLAEKAGTGAIRQMMAEEGFSADTRLNFTFDTGSDYFGELTLGVDTECDKDVRGKELSASTTLSMMNYEFGHVDLYGDQDMVCISFPELLIDGLYVENENVLGQYNDSIWATMFGETEEEDFSIDLFEEPWLFADEEGVINAFLERYAPELEECRRHMTIEKAGEELYRVSFDELCFNELVRQVLYDYVNFTMAGREEAMGALSYFDVISGAEDISFLFEINSENRIESIRIEEPLSLYQGEMQLSGDIYFLGDECSIDKMQGKIEIKTDREEQTQACELTWQIVQSLESEDYRMESDIRCSVTENGDKTNYSLDYDLACNAGRDSFTADLSSKSPLGVLQMTAEGDLSHIQKGESFDLKLDEAVLSVDDEELLLIRGEYGVEPLKRRVTKNVKPKKSFFELSENDLDRWIDDIIDEYDYMLEGLWW